MGAVKIRNTTVNGGMTGRDKTINKVFAFKDGKSYSQMKRFGQGSATSSTAQQLIRNLFTALSIGWSQLFQSQRDAWNAAAPDWVNTDVFGNKTQSGKNLYLGANIAKVTAGASQINIPFSKDADAYPSEASMSLVAGVLTLNVPFFQYSDSNRVVLRVSPQLSAGTSSNAKYVNITNYGCESDIVDIVTGAYIAKYGALQAGKRIFYEVCLVSNGGNKTVYHKDYVDIP